MSVHLVASLMTPGHFRTAWRLPHADPLATFDVEHYVRLARTADETGLDAVFLGDAPALGPDVESAPGNGIDPLVLIGHLLARTSRVGAVITASATYNSPYNLARRFQSLDMVSGGRAAINIVTTYHPAAAANFGLAEPLDKETRYRRAHELLDVVTRLWDGWASDALVLDKESGRYADASRIRAADHRGEFFSVAGPLPLPSGPQGRPVVVQAGGSEGGLRLAGDHADVVFTVAQTRARAVAFRDDVRRRAVGAGRDADQLKVSLGVIVLVADDEDDARRRTDELFATVPVDDLARATLSALGLPGHGLDEVIRLEDIAEVPPGASGSTGFALSSRALLAEHPMSARELVRHSAGTAGGHRLLIGTSEQIADDLEHWWRAGAADGFTIMYADIAVDFERFARRVVPLLVERGLFTPAAAGTTLRQRLGLAHPHQGRDQTSSPAAQIACS